MAFTKRTITNGSTVIDKELLEYIQDGIIENQNGIIENQTTLAGHDDYVIAQDTSNGWTWRKWASGIAECWKNDIALDELTINAGGYATLSLVLPFSFIDTNQLYRISLNGIGAGYNLTAGTPWKAGGTAIVRVINNGASEVKGVTFDLHITGRWDKEA